MRIVSRLSIAPVKGMALVHPQEIKLESFGVVENRRFHIVDEDGRRYGQIRNGTLVRIAPTYDAEADLLSLLFPDGGVVADAVALGEQIVTDFYGRAVPGRVVEGPWNEAVSEYAGKPLRLVKTDEPGAGVDRGNGSVSLLADASLDALAGNAGRDAVDARRFRMLIGVDGCEAHEEDEWVGQLVRVGSAVVRVRDQVARCAITTQDPDSGVPDFDTLREIKSYRGTRNDNGTHIDFGVFGEVKEPGVVRLGDAVEPNRKKQQRLVSGKTRHIIGEKNDAQQNDAGNSEYSETRRFKFDKQRQQSQPEQNRREARQMLRELLGPRHLELLDFIISRAVFLDEKRVEILGDTGAEQRLGRLTISLVRFARRQ